MAAENPVESLQEEATCPVCLEYFTEPVTLECGHNFCRACISQCWEGSDTAASCPQCRETVQQRNLRPNRQLANVLEIAERLSLQAAKGAGGDGVCGEHQETLKLFCEEDQTPICVACDRSRAHRAHTVVPVEEAAQKYKAYLKILREEREKLLGFKVTGEGKSQENTQTERQKIVSQFQQLRHFLEEQERLLLAQLDEEIVRIQNENFSKFSEEISHLSELIGEMEGKCQMPASEFLQDIGSTLSRWEKGKFQQPEEISPELEERVSGFSQKTIALLEALRKFKDKLQAELRWRRARLYAVEVTVDPDTAHPDLVLSEDWKCVRLGDTRQDLPDNHERFDSCACVLGTEGFAGGRHYWEVEVGDKTRWTLGVCRESVSRKGNVTFTPGNGCWVVWLRDGGYKALTSTSTPLPMSVRPSWVGIFLDYKAGKVSFYNVTDRSHLFTFTDTFSGKLRPYFNPSLNTCGTNVAPLIICPVPAQARGNLCP
ncbi:zinc finger protein RFP-like [Chrysemys picta bellii]|uniref:zinc finger protein RFP-like n=1 Tax=Chrysemys picta bellii TaxID=8478 RepID=UPI0032B2C758